MDYACRRAALTHGSKSEAVPNTQALPHRRARNSSALATVHETWKNNGTVNRFILTFLKAVVIWTARRRRAWSPRKLKKPWVFLATAGWLRLGGQENPGFWGFSGFRGRPSSSFRRVFVRNVHRRIQRTSRHEGLAKREIANIFFEQKREETKSVVYSKTPKTLKRRDR